jgi:signal transduction histidine kinase/ActR/RegA family two-component response regulator
MAPLSKESLWIIRYAMVSPAIIIAIIMSYREKFLKYMQFIVFCILLIAGMGICIMIMITPNELTYAYYTGVILVFMLGYGNSKIRFIWATLAGWLNVIAYEIIAIFFLNIQPAILINNNFFFIGANIIGMLSSYSVEIYARRNFYMSKMLKNERVKVFKLNENLEKIVFERTKKLVIANKSLSAEITARSETEKQKHILESKLLQSQKMESVGTLAGGIAHDFNNILSAILGYTEICQIEYLDNPQLQEYLHEIEKSGLRARELTGQILAFARKSSEKLSPVGLLPIVEEVLSFIRSSIPSSIEIKKNLMSDSLICGNATQIYQILLNLFTNAATAMEESGGILRIGLCDINLTSSLSETLPPGNYIELSISDTGVGIEPKILSSIFEPYFTTKEKHKGTGMGLAVVHGIVTSYGGEIHVSSSVGKGTEFIIYLPITDNKEITGNADNLSSTLRGTEHILFVDDEKAICKIEMKMLKKLGYTVTYTTSSIEAVQLFRENPEAYDLIITDLTMPMLSGDQLARTVSEIRKDIPVILCTGYNNLSSEHQYQNVKEYCHKPLLQAELSIAIRKALDNSSAGS